ncbi:hypothetical protein [Streptomyces sp900116325]|uniref:hypothetical protein n=1 Tax=Streptomyces sp. 900116325 TaxID=3154295 RepID=UPI0033BEEA47
MTTAFDSIALGGKYLARRVVAAPRTRIRVYGPDAELTELPATYFALRSGASSGR